MPACPQCSEPNPDRAKFCLACGAALASAGGHEVRKTVTVLFADLAGSTELGERLDPESIRRVMSRYFEEMQAVLERHGGTVEKFIGDAIMAVFGIPTVREDDALRAVRAAAEMRKRLGVLNEELDRDWGVRLRVRTGVNTGEVVAGDPTRGQSFVSGDTVNVAARLEQAATPDEILLGERTWSLAFEAIEAEPIEALTLKGKSEALTAWRLVDVSPRVATHRGGDHSPFVGRAHEVGELGRVLERAINERVCVLGTIVGPAGIGKSRLVREFTLSAGPRARVVSGHCLPYGDGITYWPLAEIVSDLGGDGLPGAVTSALGADAPVVAERIAAAVGSAEAPGSPAEIFWAFRKLFEALAKERPLIVVIDDIQWAEPTLLDLIEYIIGFASGVPIMMLCLARAELFDNRPSWAVPRQNAFLISLQPIAESDVSALIERLSTQLTPIARTQVAQAAEGNPLFIEQLLAFNADVDHGLGAIVIPQTIHALLAARIDRLGPADRAVVERAAIEGRSFHRGAVVELLEERARPTVGACLISLARKEFIQPDQALFPGDDGFRFGHILIRDAAYEALPKQLRADLHERYALWLERVAGARAHDYEEILAYHLEQAYRYQAELGRNDEAGRLAKEAGGRLGTAGLRALARGDIPAAVNLISRAADALPADGTDRLLLLPELATALVESGELVRAEAILLEAETRSRNSSQELAEWRARIARIGLRHWTKYAGDDTYALDDAERAVDACTKLGDELGLARSWQLVGMIRGDAGRSVEAADAYQHALEHARRAGAGREESATLSWLLITEWFGATPRREGIRHCQEILERPKDRRVEGVALMELGCFWAMQGGFDEARSYFGRGQALFEDLGLQILAAGSSQEFFDIEMLAGDPAAAEQRLRLACHTLEQMGEKGFLSTRFGCLAEAIYAQGRVAEAALVSKQAEAATAQDPTDLDAGFRWRAVRAKTLAREGAFEAAEGLAREAATLIGATDWLNSRASAELDFSEVLQLAGRDAEALPHMEEALRLFELKENEVAAARARARISELSQRIDCRPTRFPSVSKKKAT